MNREKFDWKLLKQILKYLKFDKRKLILVFLCFFITTITSFLQPLVIKKITDDGLIHQDMSLIIYAAGILLGLILAGEITSIFLTKLFADIHNESEYYTYHLAFEKLLKLKYEYFADKNSSEIINMLSTDVSRVTSLTDRNNIMLISYIFQIFSGLAGLIIISPVLTLIVLLMVPVKYVTVTKLSKMQETKMHEYLSEITGFSSWMSEVISGVKEIKLWNAYQTQTDEFRRTEKSLLKRKKEFTMIDAWNMAAEIFLEWSVTILLYIAGGFLLIAGHLSLGGLFAFISYSGFVTGPISAIMNVKMLFAQILPSARRFLAFMDLKEETPGELKTFDTGELSFHHVSFAYDPARKILENVSLTIPEHAKAAIIGANGSGKSTILNLLLRFLEPEEGEIRLKGKNIQELNIQSYRNLFSVVGQNPFVFNKSIKDNIDLESNKKQEELDEIYQKSGVAQFLVRMPEGENSIIGNNGAKLSGGERQKLAVARAMIRDTPYIILDEATSGFDVDSDSYLHHIVVNEMKEKTVIIVTHRYENLEGMDLIYKIEDGKLCRLK